jgi:hypothetical protein
MRVSVYNREKITKDGDIINIKTTSFHCETCDEFINSADIIVDGMRKAKVDRRKKPNTDENKPTYKGREKRSGRERRIWVDRIQEIASKLSEKKDT